MASGLLALRIASGVAGFGAVLAAIWLRDINLVWVGGNRRSV